MLLKWGRVVFWTAAFLLCFSSVVVAQTNQTAQPNPLELELNESDPLLPNPPVERPLSPLELRRLRQALDELNTQALAQLQAGNRQQAFEIWYREIRLRRVLGGQLEEVQALGRVGEIAWGESFKPEVQLITARLETIQKEAEAKKTLDGQLLRALGKAYEQIRLPGQALAIYERVLADARQRNDAAEIEATLKTIAQLHMGWFDYLKAAATYEELLNIAQEKRDRVNEVIYIQQLAYIYDQAKKPENALQMKQRLLASYPPNDPRIPELKLAIAADHEALNQLDEASRIYQEVYAEAFVLREFANASEALRKLAALYQADNQPEFALQVYDVLIKVEQESYNYYGLMNAYDQIGQIHLEQKNYAQALAAFQKGLELAQSLKYQENYFTRQIERANQQSSQ